MIILNYLKNNIIITEGISLMFLKKYKSLRMV